MSSRSNAGADTWRSPCAARRAARRASSLLASSSAFFADISADSSTDSWSGASPSWLAGSAQRPFEGAAQAREGFGVAVGIELFQPHRIGAADHLGIVAGRDAELVP